MTQQIINVGANANDGTGEPLRDAFTAVNENFSEVYAAGPVGTNVKISGNIVTTTITNLGLTLAGNGIGNIQANSSIVPGTPGVYDLGAPNNAFNYAYSDYFVGNGALLTGVPASSVIANGNSNVTVGANSNVTVGVAGVGNVATFATTGLYINGLVSAVGNVTGNYFVGNGSQLTGLTAGSAITNGNSNVQVYANGNIAISAAGVSNVMVVSSQDVAITGNLSVTGNATLSGNILGDRIQNGNTSIDIQTASGNANISVGGVSNIAVFTTTGVDVTGNISANVFNGNGTGLTGVLADRGNDTNNWDILTQMGVYLVNRTSWSGTQGTPLDSQVFVGLLEVQTSQAQTTTQIFYPGLVEAADIKIQWNRALWAGTWTPWIKMTNDGQQISGGVF
jgi:hypothetical protein